MLFLQYPADGASFEMLQNMTAINQVDTGIADEGQIIDRRNMVDMRISDGIDVNKTRYIPLAAAKVQFH